MVKRVNSYFYSQQKTGIAGTHKNLTAMVRLSFHNICGGFRNKNSSFPSEKPNQTGQTQIRLLLKKQSDQGLPCLLF